MPALGKPCGYRNAEDPVSLDPPPTPSGMVAFPLLSQHKATSNRTHGSHAHWPSYYWLLSIFSCDLNYPLFFPSSILFTSIFNNDNDRNTDIRLCLFLISVAKLPEWNCGLKGHTHLCHLDNLSLPRAQQCLRKSSNIQKMLQSNRVVPLSCGQGHCWQGQVLATHTAQRKQSDAPVALQTDFLQSAGKCVCMYLCAKARSTGGHISNMWWHIKKHSYEHDSRLYF